MSRFEDLILEALDEAGKTKKAAPANKYLIGVSEGKMRKYSDGVYYFYKFDKVERDGTARPLFVPAQYKKYCQTFETEDQAWDTLDQILRDFPIYDKLFGKLGVTELSASNTKNSNTEYEPELKIRNNKTNTAGNNTVDSSKENNSFSGKLKNFMNNIKAKFQ